MLRESISQKTARVAVALALVLAASALLAQDEVDKLVSGPQPGQTLPGPFDAFTIYSGVAKKLDQEVVKFKEDKRIEIEAGDKEVLVELLRLEKKATLARNTQHCLVSEYGLNPVVMAFVREPAADKDGPLKSLLGTLDDLCKRYERIYFASCVIFLSPDARSSVNSDETDPAKLVEEAIARTSLNKRLEARAGELKHVAVAHHPPTGPAGYKIDPKAEATILFYYKQKVLANFTFAAGKMSEEAVEAIAKEIDDMASKIKKK